MSLNELDPMCVKRVRVFLSSPHLSFPQGAPLEELREGLGTISAIAGEWGIDVHRVTKGRVSKTPRQPRYRLGAPVRCCAAGSPEGQPF